MANDIRQLNEAYKHIVEALEEEGTLQHGTVGEIETLCRKLPVNHGIAFNESPKAYEDDNAINIEKWPGRDEWYFKAMDYESGSHEFETDDELREFIEKHIHEYGTAFKYYTIYPLTDSEGMKIGTYVPPDPHEFDQRYGDYEQYGPDPGPRMQDLQ